MAVLVDQMELGECLRVELYEGGQVWVSKQSEVLGVRNLVELKLAAAPALKLLEFLRLWEETLVCERGVPHGSTGETVRGLPREGVEPTGGPGDLQASNGERLPEFFFIPSPQGLVPVIVWDYAWLGKHTSGRPDDSTA